MATESATLDRVTVTKTCTVCKIEKPVTEFGIRSKYADGRNYRCSTCHTAAQRKYRAANVEKLTAKNRAYREANRPRVQANRRRYLLLTKYGIAPEEYDRRLQEQGHACAACGSSDPGTTSGVFHIDHCHREGHVRALLCRGCNVALGQVDDDIERLRLLISYLERDRRRRDGD